MNSTFLWRIFGISFALIFLFVFFYLLTMIGRHNKRKKADMKLSEEYEQLPDSIKVLYNSVLNRRQSSIVNYLIFQLTTKVFGFTGVLYSIYGFGLTFFDFADDSSKTLAMLVSFVSLLCVIIALYLSPERRISEYIIAWRRYDKLVTDMIGSLPSYNGKPGKSPIIRNEVTKISKEISEIEHKITSDES